MGIDVVAHIPAQDLAAVLSLFGDTTGVVGGKPQKLRSGFGLIKLNFSKASVRRRVRKTSKYGRTPRDSWN